MRLQLIASLTLVCGVGGAARAQDVERGDGTATTMLGVYDDDDATTAVTSLVDAEVGVADDVTIGAHVLVDRVSPASIDGVSAAPPRVGETRFRGGVRVG